MASTGEATRPAHAGNRSAMPLLVVGVIVFLGSELMFFASLFGMYFTLRGQALQWPPPGIELEFLKPFVFTCVLVASSFTMQMSVIRVRQGNRASMRRWIWATSQPTASPIATPPAATSTN